MSSGKHWLVKSKLVSVQAGPDDDDDDDDDDGPDRSLPCTHRVCVCVLFVCEQLQLIATDKDYRPRSNGVGRGGGEQL